MISIKKSITIAVSPPKVWEVLGDPTQATEYVPGIVSARFENNERICIDMAGNEIRESIELVPEEWTLRFKHTKSPLPVSSSDGQFVIAESNNASTVSMIWNIEPMDATMSDQLTQMLGSAATMTLGLLRQKLEASIQKKFIATVKAKMRFGTVDEAQQFHDNLFNDQAIAYFQSQGNIGHTAYLDGDKSLQFLAIDEWLASSPTSVLDFYQTGDFTEIAKQFVDGEPEIAIWQDHNWRHFDESSLQASA